MTNFNRAMYAYNRSHYPWYAEESAYLNGYDDDGDDWDDDDSDNSDDGDE